MRRATPEPGPHTYSGTCTHTRARAHAQEETTSKRAGAHADRQAAAVHMSGITIFDVLLTLAWLWQIGPSESQELNYFEHFE